MSLKVLKDFWIARKNWKPGETYSGGDVDELLSKGLIAHEPDSGVVVTQEPVFHVEQSEEQPKVSDLGQAPKQKGKKKKQG